MQSLMLDIGMKVTLTVRSDATAAIGMVARMGLGKVRHLSVSDLWVQHAQRDGRITHEKWLGQDNPADMFTKPVGQDCMDRHCLKIGVICLRGRSS